MTDIKEKLNELDRHIKLSQYGYQIDFNYLYKLLDNVDEMFRVIQK